MSFWRKLNKAVFSISLVAACIAVLGGSIWGFTSESLGNSWLGFVILLGGAILILVLFSAWGILLEFLDNVADIRRAVCNGQHIPSSQTIQKEQISNSTPSVSQTKPFSSEPVVVAKEWTCTGCGEKNDNESNFCFNCGKPKE